MSSSQVSFVSSDGYSIETGVNVSVIYMHAYFGVNDTRKIIKIINSVGTRREPLGSPSFVCKDLESSPFRTTLFHDLIRTIGLNQQSSCNAVSLELKYNTSVPNSVSFPVIIKREKYIVMAVSSSAVELTKGKSYCLSEGICLKWQVANFVEKREKTNRSIARRVRRFSRVLKIRDYRGGIPTTSKAGSSEVMFIQFRKTRNSSKAHFFRTTAWIPSCPFSF